jgi:2-oxoglutarate dehydrogenase E2 component (dihydrolipoamide succinyltransferase)
VTELFVPKLNNNDTSYTLVEWLFADGDTVRKGDIVAVVETSKAAADLEADRDGVLHRLVPELGECAFGEAIAHLFATEADRSSYLAARAATPGEKPGAEVVLTNSARELAERHGIDSAELLALGKKLVKQADVEQLVAGRTAAAESELVPLSRAQRAVAAVVSESHRTVPAALAVVKVHVDAALRAARKMSRQTKTMIGLPELLIKAVADLRPEFPALFASLAEDGRAVRHATSSDIGVTVDVGTGLFVPVLRDVQRLTAAEVADTLMGFRERAMGDGFDAADLAGGSLMVSLHTDADVVLAAPIVYPGQTCVVCLAGSTHELVLDETGEVTARRVVNISACYDHRVVNGREAVTFLRHIKDAIEVPPDEDIREAAQTGG